WYFVIFVFIRFIGINPERGSKTCRGKVVSKKTGKVVNKKSATVNPKFASTEKSCVFRMGFHLGK
ncbi:hypothetical protein, partial [Plesiomonas sp.]|uniref:hypothetical protein n=1 Tax=Plesiomonas sp. TaxID=2486279 RepID=UPI003F3D3823